MAAYFDVLRKKNFINHCQKYLLTKITTAKGLASNIINTGLKSLYFIK